MFCTHINIAIPRIFLIRNFVAQFYSRSLEVLTQPSIHPTFGKVFSYLFCCLYFWHFYSLCLIWFCGIPWQAKFITKPIQNLNNFHKFNLYRPCSSLKMASAPLPTKLGLGTTNNFSPCVIPIIKESVN